MPLKDLNQLRTQVKSLLDKAVDKTAIEEIGKIGATIDSIEKENGELETKLAEATTAYADLVKHTSFKGEADKVGEQDKKVAPSLDELIAQQVEKESKA